MTAREIAEFVEQIAPHDRLVGVDPGASRGFVFGDPEIEVSTVATCWGPTAPVLQKALEQGVNFVIAHEYLLYPRYQGIWFQTLTDVASKPPNLRRMEILQNGGICVYITHTNWDAAPGWGIVDAFSKAMDFEKEYSRAKFIRVFEIEPMSFRELAEYVKQKLHLPHIRVAGNLDREIRRVGTAIGGLGQVVGIPEELARLGAQAVIFGEVLDYTVRFALEAGLSVIETEHWRTEDFGVAGLADQIRKAFPQLKVIHIPTGTPWTHI